MQRPDHGGGAAPSSSGATIEFHAVTKRYVQDTSLRRLVPFLTRRKITALNGISFECRRGEVFGVIGPNGAGKTTLSKLVANLLLPDEGQIVVCGRRLDTGNHETRRAIGYATCDERSFFWRLTGRQNLQFFLALYDQRSDAEAMRLVRYFELDRALDVPFGQYSTGMRKRMAVIRALMCRPEIILFDEATNGLDPISVARLKRLLVEEHGHCTIIWTTHRLDEITQLCSQVLVIREGNLLFKGGIEGLKRRYRSAAEQVEVTLRGETAHIEQTAREMFDVAEATRLDGSVTITIAHDGDDLLQRVTALADRTHAEVIRFETLDVSMEDIYVSLVKT